MVLYQVIRLSASLKKKTTCFYTDAIRVERPDFLKARADKVSQIFQRFLYPFTSIAATFLIKLFNSITIHYSPAEWARQLFKSSTDSANLLVEIEKKFISFAVEGHHKWGRFCLFGEFYPALGAKPMSQFFPSQWANFFDETCFGI